MRSKIASPSVGFQQVRAKLVAEASGTTIKLTGDADDRPLVIDDVIRTETVARPEDPVMRTYALVTLWNGQQTCRWYDAWAVSHAIRLAQAEGYTVVSVS